MQKQDMVRRMIKYGIIVLVASITGYAFGALVSFLQRQAWALQ